MVIRNRGSWTWSAVRIAAICAAPFLIILLATSPISAQSSSTPDANESLDQVVLQLTWFHQFQFAGYYAAQLKGYYAEEGLNVDIRERHPDVSPVDSVLAGEADFGNANADIVYLRMQGKPLVVLAAIMQHSPWGILVLEDSAITVPEDLVGKKIEIEYNYRDAEVLAMFRGENIATDDMTFVRLSPSVSDLIDGTVDARISYMTNGPFCLREAGITERFIRPINYGIDFYGDTLFTSERQIRDHPERVAAFRRASLRGWEYAMAHPEELVEYIYTTYYATPSESPVSYTRENFRYEAKIMAEELVHPELIPVGHMNPERWQRIADTYAALGMAEPLDSLDNFIYNPDPQRNYMWVYVLFACLASLAIAGVAARIWNQQLRTAVADRGQKLQESGQRLQDVIDSITTFVGLYSLDGILLEANQAPLDAAGIKREDVIGKPFWDTYWWSYSQVVQEQLRDALRRAAEGETVRYDVPVRVSESENGEPVLITIDITFGPLRDSKGKITQLVGSAVDITERKRAEDALRLESEITRNMSEGICLVSVDDGTIVYVNRRIEEIFGYNSGEMDGMFSGKLNYGGEVEGRVTAEKIVESAEKTGSWNGEIHNIKKDGTPFWTYANVSTHEDPTHGSVLASAVADITERKRTEVALIESEAKFRGFIETSSDGMIVVDSSGTIMQVNAAAQVMFGYSPAELLDRPIEVLIPNRYIAHSQLTKDYGESPHSRRMAELKTLSAVRKDGSEFPAEIALNPLQTPEGLIVLASVRDVSERVSAEEALRASEQQLHQAQKMDALGQLAGGVAHDFNNMLQAITGYTGLAIDALSVNDPVYEYLEEVMLATERSTALVRRLLTFSRTQPNERKAIDLDETVSDLLKLLSRVLGEQVELISLLQSEGKSLLADPSQIEQLLVNLCINARDAMPEGGTITIETRVKRFDKEFCATNPWASEGEYVTLSVTDDGEGIPKEIQNRVFEPFFTTKEISSGTGLGLAAAYAIVTRHGGFLKLDSEPGEGSRFSFFFPVTELAQTVEPHENDQIEITGGSETILYAEDEEIIRKLGENLLKKAGYSVLSCADGEEATRVALEQREAIDLAILDVVMPKVGGKEVFDTLREIQPTMPVLFTSGYSFDLLGEKFLDEERVALISKPHTSSELLQSVRKLLD